MTNEEKQIKDIAEKFYLNEEQPLSDDIEKYRAFIRGAEWKDQQFKEYLVKKNTEISNTKAKLGRDDADYMLCTLKSLFIDEIINELFGED